MIFRRNIKAQAQPIGDLQSLADFLGLTTDELNIKGTAALREITVFTCIKILSETMSKLPLKVYQDNNGIRKAAEHYLNPLLKLRPNEYMSASDFWKCVETQKNIYGNAYAWIERIKYGKKAGEIIGFYPLDSSRVTIYVDSKGLISSYNKLWYVYTDNLGNQYKLESMDVLHYKGVTFNGISGISPIEYLKLTIENAKGNSSFLNNSFKSGMQTKGIIHYVGDLDPKAEKIFKEKFEQMSGGLKNANKVSLLPFGYQFQPLSLSNTDAQFLETGKFTIAQLTAAFGIKLHQVNDLTTSSYASTSEANREFYVDTLMSILTMYEQETVWKCFTTDEIDKGYYSKFNADVILRGDIKTRYEAYRTGLQAGFITANEVRSLEEMEAKDGGDELLVNGSMVKIKDAGSAYGKGGSKNE